MFLLLFVFTCTYSLSCFVFFFLTLVYFANYAPFLFAPYVNLVVYILLSRPF